MRASSSAAACGPLGIDERLDGHVVAGTHLRAAARRGGARGTVLSRFVRITLVACLAAATSGWSNGCTPMNAPASADGHLGHDDRAADAVGGRRDAELHVGPVVAVDLRRTGPLPDDRHQADAVLAERLGHELLEPQPERRHLVGQPERELVVAHGHAVRHRPGEHERGVGAGRLVRPAVLQAVAGRRG